MGARSFQNPVQASPLSILNRPASSTTQSRSRNIKSRAQKCATVRRQSYVANLATEWFVSRFVSDPETMTKSGLAVTFRFMVQKLGFFSQVFRSAAHFLSFQRRTSSDKVNKLVTC